MDAKAASRVAFARDDTSDHAHSSDGTGDQSITSTTSEIATLITGGGGGADEIDPVNGFFKRGLDLIGASFLLVFFAPLMALIYFLVRLDGGPAIYAHKRVGKSGVLFSCYKFRSMVPDADRVLNELLARDEQVREEWETEQKLKRDPRVTRIGAFLRRKSLDELPQLFNILKGDMSLVGPRPITVEETKRYGGDISYYYANRPGLTGAWQVSGRNEVTYRERVALDVAYVRNWSFAKDLAILLKTVGVVLTGRGAA